MHTGWREPLSEHASLVELLEARADELGDATYATFPDQELTFESLARRSSEVASGLADRGVDADDRVCVFMHNDPAFLELFFAVARLGAVAVPLNASLKGEDLAYALSDAEPSALLVGPDCRDRYEDVREDATVDLELTLDDASAGYERLDDVADPTPSLPTVELAQADTLAMVYTSGTTGMPKAVRLPHGAYLTVGTELAERVVRPSDGDVLYMSQPLFHIFAQLVATESLVAGVPFAMERWFSKSKFWDRVERHDATVIHFSSAIAEILYEETDPGATPVRIALGAIAEDLQADFGEKFGCQVLPLYGLTESAGIACTGTVEDPHLGSVGVPTRYAEVAVVDEDDEPVGPGERGEIVIRPSRPNAMFQGYFGKPERTVEALGNQWLHTGDIGYYDDDGALHFLNRKSYFLRRKGENVSVYEVERILEQHPRVGKAVVVGVDAEIAGEEVLAVVRPAPGEPVPDAAELVAFCDERLAYFKVPRYVRFVESFPRTETKGTIERYRLEDAGTDDAWDREAAGYELDR